ncbi:hypothetical protein ACIRNY_11330 [Capnocytophaga canimorsus]|uniref:hypothetical protein n=1 Tax=Capnocytophaga canimorsus TaxID=28188 RepID=UPI00385138F1
MYQIITDHILPFLFGAGGSGLVYYFLDKNKRKTEAVEKLQVIYDEFITDVKKQFDELKTEKDLLKEQNKILKQQNLELKKQNQELKELVDILKKNNKNSHL